QHCRCRHTACSCHNCSYNPGTTNDYLVFAILVTIFCFWPTGIVAIVFAAKVRSLFSSGDIQGAEQASASAELWTKISLGIGIVWITVYVIIQL
ncbi:hypothetical protein BSL78_24087, partial [Apostichopus japonicus]